MLNQPSLNPVQYWSLGYWLVMDRRTQWQDKRAELEIQTFNLFPERWADIYREQVLGSTSLQTVQNAPGDIGVAFNGEPELPVSADDLHSLGDWVDDIGTPRRMSGAQVAYDQDVSAVLGYVAPGDTGRRV